MQKHMGTAALEKGVLNSKILNGVRLPFALLSLLIYFNMQITVEGFGQKFL